MGRIGKGEDMRDPELTSIAEVDHLLEECAAQNIPIFYSSQVNIATPYLLENLLKRLARLEKAHPEIIQENSL